MNDVLRNSALRPLRSVRRGRAGLTLLEVVLALAIAAIAMSLLAQLVTIGNRAAAASRDQTKAQLLAESIMAQVTSGVMTLDPTSGTSEDDPSWLYDVSVESQGDADTGTMYFVTVTVTHEISQASFGLTQWVYAPPEPEEEIAEEPEDLGGGA